MQRFAIDDLDIELFVVFYLMKIIRLFATYEKWQMRVWSLCDALKCQTQHRKEALKELLRVAETYFHFEKSCARIEDRKRLVTIKLQRLFVIAFGAATKHEIRVNYFPLFEMKF